MAPWQWDLVEYCSIDCWQLENPRQQANSAIPVPKPPRPLTEPRRSHNPETAQLVLQRPGRKEPEKKKRSHKKKPVFDLIQNQGYGMAKACIQYAERHGMPISEAKRLWGLK
jgi:hypothetical protein